MRRDRRAPPPRAATGCSASRHGRDPRRADQRSRGVAGRDRAEHADARGDAGPLDPHLGPALSFIPVPVLYLAVDGDLDELATLRAAMRVGPFAREAAWPFVPHVTIGTDLSEERLERRRAALAEFSTTVSLTHVQVLQEQRDPDEVRRWRPIADAVFGGRTVSGRGGIELEVTEAAGAGWTLTARHQGAVVGEARGWTTTDGVAQLSWLSVAETERGIGIGAGCSPASRTSLEGRARRCSSPRPRKRFELLRARGWRRRG